jgi:tellurite resistance-related uncharacterized protein
MQRVITGFHRDDAGDWVAELSCLHGQHVRHQPPFRVAPWVLEDDERQARIGTPLDCPLCDRAEMPDGLRPVRSTPTWDQATVPAALRRRHRIGTGTWGLLEILAGRLHFTAETDPPLDRTVGPDRPQAIPPEVAHSVEPVGDVRFRITFLTR